MQARKDSREPLNKRPFDLQEAVVLLDVYLDMVKNGTSITKAAEKASVRLRNLAKRNGYVISDSYRSAGGLVNRLRSLGGLYEGQESKSAPGTPMFAEVVSLYKNNRARYEEILSTEKSVASQDGQNSGEQRAAHGKATAKEERTRVLHFPPHDRQATRHEMRIRKRESRKSRRTHRVVFPSVG